MNTSRVFDMRARVPGDPTPSLFSAAPSTSYRNSSLSPGLSGDCSTSRTLRSRIVCVLCGCLVGQDISWSFK